MQNHTEFHGVPLSQEETESGQTRFHRRHMVMPCYEALPGRVTLVHGVKIPKAPDQKVVFENGTVLRIAAGATACKCHALHANITDSEQSRLRSACFLITFNRGAKLCPQYHDPIRTAAYEWIRNCKAKSDSLTIAHTGCEIPLDELPLWKNDHVQSHTVSTDPGPISSPSYILT